MIWLVAASIALARVMNTNTLNTLIVILTAGLLMCVGLLISQHVQFKSLQRQLNEQAAHIYQVEKASEIKQANRTSIHQVRTLSSGIYELTTEVAVDPLEGKRSVYTIYHFVLNIAVGAFRSRLQFGYASSGLLSHVFYFDYDGDGKIDMRMMEEYADSIPVVGTATSWLIDPELSQSLYNAFLLNSENAEKLSMEVIASRLDSKLQAVWAWITESSSDFGDWIKNAMEID